MDSDLVSTSSSPNVLFIAVLLLAALVCLLFAFSIFWNRFARSTHMPDLENGGLKMSKGLLGSQRQDSLSTPAPPPYPGHKLKILPPPPAYHTSDLQNVQTHSPSASYLTRERSHSESGAILLFVVPSEVPLYSPWEDSPSLYSPTRLSAPSPGPVGIAVPSPAANSSDSASPNLEPRQRQNVPQT